MYSGYHTKYHSHNHTVTHGVKDGTGEKLRGITIDRSRAHKALLKAIAEVEQYLEDNKEALDDEENQVAEKIAFEISCVQENNDELRKRYSHVCANRSSDPEKYDELQTEYSRLLSLPSPIFWGRSKETKKAIAQVQEELDLLKYQDKFYRDSGRFMLQNIKPYLSSFVAEKTTILRQLEGLKEKFYVVDLTVEDPVMSREDVLEIARFEQTTYAERVQTEEKK